MCTGWASASVAFWAACSTRDESGELLGSESSNGGKDGGFNLCVQLWVNFQNNYVNWASIRCMGPSIAQDYTYKAATNSQADSQPGRAMSWEKSG